ncbi:MAG: hypothetical protein GXP25_13215 [Planctomycetes bacterium]|nr:hypothetical protein [Planctomycetota bacterium]
MKTLLKRLIFGMAMWIGTTTAEARPPHVVRPAYRTSRTIYHGTAHSRAAARIIHAHNARSARHVVSAPLLKPKVATRVVTVPTYVSSGTDAVVTETKDIEEETPVEVPVATTEETTGDEAAEETTEEAVVEVTEENATDEATEGDEEKADEEKAEEITEESTEEAAKEGTDEATEESKDNMSKEDSTDENAEESPSE